MANAPMVWKQPVHVNWLAAVTGAPEFEVIEFPLFTGAKLGGDVVEPVSTYGFLKAVPGLTASEPTQVTVAVRMCFPVGDRGAPFRRWNLLTERSPDVAGT